MFRLDLDWSGVQAVDGYGNKAQTGGASEAMSGVVLVATPAS